MKQQKPILHARDHLPGGADPIPQLATTAPPPGSPPPPQPLKPTIPSKPKPGEVWHWWRFLEPSYSWTLVDHWFTPDVVTNNTVYKMGFSEPFTHAATPFEYIVEMTPGHDGPPGGETSLLRLWNDPPYSHNTGNYWQANASTGISFDAGSEFTVLGWFWFAAPEGDILHFNKFGAPSTDTHLVLNTDGSVTLHRGGTDHSSAAGVVANSGGWNYIAVTLQAGRFRVYVNPGPPEASAYDATYGNAFPFSGPMGMETWGLALGDYTADQLAGRLNTAAVKTVALRLNPPSAELPPGMTHAAYITQTAADVATLQAAGISVIGWGPADATSGADLTATGVTGWMPQVESPGEYSALNTQLAAGAGAGLPKAVVWTESGINSSSQVTTLNAAGITGYAVESYASAGYPFNDLNRTLWQGTQFGMTPGQSIPIVGTFRGETPADYTGFDENVLGNYGLYNLPQTSQAQLDEFAQLNHGTVMFSHPVIDIPDPGGSYGVLSIGSSATFNTSASSYGSFEGYVAEVVVYNHALSGSDHRELAMNALYGDTGVVPPNEQIPAGGITPAQIQPGANDQHLVTDSGGVVKWAADTGGGASTLDDLTDVSTAGAADNDVLTYDSGTTSWAPSAGTPGPTGATGAAGAAGERWFTGSGAPAGSLSDSVVGDWYLNSANGDYYEKTGSSAWTLRGNLMGPAGASGGSAIADVQTFTSSGTWSKPAGVKAVQVICIGGGGGGGGAPGAGGASARSGGAGGGGGAYYEEPFRADDLSGTVTVTVGTGGSGGAGTSAASGSNGSNGGDSSFGAYSKACGGGGGPAGAVATNSPGGGGGTYLNAGSTAASGAPAATSTTALGNQSGIRGGASAGGASEYGGTGGGSSVASNTAAFPGGTSSRGGCGGGAGGGVNATPAVGTSGAGGLAGAYVPAGGGGGLAGTSGASPAAGGAGGTVTGRYCGSGGGGGGSTVQASTTGAVGGAGGIGSGGGGGGCSSTAAGGTGGRGGDGLVIVISW